jgi:hypothetical protein
MSQHNFNSIGQMVSEKKVYIRWQEVAKTQTSQVRWCKNSDNVHQTNNPVKIAFIFISSFNSEKKMFKYDDDTVNTISD